MEGIVIIENLMIWPRDIGQMSFDEAMKAVAELGPGWRLPTIDEFREILYPNRKEIPGKVNSLYWSSDRYDRLNSWRFNFYSGFTFYFEKDNDYHVRPVRESDINSILDTLLKEF